jgi:hypothetical protein
LEGGYMIPIEELDPEKLNKNFTKEEREAIVSSAKIISAFNDTIFIIGKRCSNGRTATTAIICAKETFRGQVVERLLKELPFDWKRNLTPNANGLDLIAALRRHWMAFLNGQSPNVAKNIEASFDELEKLFKVQTLN